MATQSFFVGDIVDFHNPNAAAPTRTRVLQSATTGELVLEGVSDRGQWLLAQAVTAHVTLVHRLQKGDMVEYFSSSGQNWIETEIMKFRIENCVGEFQVDKKLGVWFTAIHPNIRLCAADKPVPPSPSAEPPLAKRQDVGARSTQFEMTPGANNVIVDASLLFLDDDVSASLGSAAFPAAPALPAPGADCSRAATRAAPTAGQDPWAASAAKLPAGSQRLPDASGGLTLTSMRNLLLEGEERLVNRFDVKIDGLETRMGQRMTVVETTQAEHGTKLSAVIEHNEVQDADIAALKVQMTKVEAMISAKMKTLSLAQDSKHETDKEAFLGGFADMPKDTLKRKAEEFIGSPPGFVSVATPGNVASFVFVKFESALHMGAFVAENKARAEEAALRLKQNLPQGTPQDKARRSTIWRGKQVLCQKLGLSENNERVVFSRRRFWATAPDGESVTPMGTLEGDDKVMWNENAPEHIRSTTSTFS